MNVNFILKCIGIWQRYYRNFVLIKRSRRIIYAYFETDPTFFLLLNNFLIFIFTYLQFYIFILFLFIILPE